MRHRRWAHRGKWSARGLALCVGAACAAWPLSGRSYPLDLWVSYQGFYAAAGLLAAVGLLAVRRWRPAAVCLAAAVFGLWPLVEGRAWSRPAVDLSAPPAPGTVRVVSFNIGPENPLWREDLARVLSWRPDLIVLIEIPVPLNRHVNRRTLGELDGWNREHRRWVDGLASPGFVLTREELERLPTPGVAFGERDLLLCSVGGGGGWLASLAHPHSPRTAERWRLGNEIWARASAELGDRAASGRPVVVGADLNSAPAGSRVRAARRAGLRMAKPLTGGWGSFPAAWPGPARVQLDDLWVSRGVEVVAWSSVEPLGSDHRAIVADLRIGGAP